MMLYLICQGGSFLEHFIRMVLRATGLQSFKLDTADVFCYMGDVGCLEAGGTGLV